MTKTVNLTEKLKHYFGFDKFEGEQEAIIRNVLGGNAVSYTHLVAKNIYGAKEVIMLSRAKKQLALIKQFGFDKYPVCIAKTQYSFSEDPKAYGMPKDFEMTIREFVINSGAEMIVAIAGNIMRMPGLPKSPQAERIEVVNGVIEGLS